MEVNILTSDLFYILRKLGEQEKMQFSDATILVTGCAGFLGFYLMHFFALYKDELQIKKVIGLDNFKLGKPKWIQELIDQSADIEVHHFDIVTDDIQTVGDKNIHYIIHMASIASPSLYRKYPIETVDANIWGLRKLLDFALSNEIKGFLFFSSSEIYGDPVPEMIPTPEYYRGNVSVIGPRACYDEAKRFGETLCYLYATQYQIPITIVRPFNNYGPGMKLEDRRVPADFAKAIFEGRDLQILSDGTPTRTFCYVADAISGYLKALVYGKFDYFNIGIDKPEISVKQLANIYLKAGREIFGYKGVIKFGQSTDKEYLTHNPSRRCPDITKARKILGFSPEIDVEHGVRRFLQLIKERGGEL